MRLESPSSYRSVARTSVRLFAGAGALGLAVLLLPPREARGYALEGEALDLSQRDLRVFDNFSDPEAHGNAQPDPEFPGATGPALAIWKAAVEWGSERHGSGQGDPLNLDGLGSGGANFDFCWQGAASGVGGTDDNIVSEIAGSSGGIYAFTELPIADGWRIRFYADAAIWHDAPAGPPNQTGHKDIQGIATHELGHALGLAHSADPSATMLSVVLGTGAGMRSIESDDRLGIQAVYGAKSATKPHIAALFVPAPGTLLVAGANFAASGNELWFPDASLGANGTALVVAGLASSAGGTQILCALPAAAGPGDVLVHVPGTSGATLSNAFPFAPDQPSCPPLTFYGTPKLTSQGSLPSLYVSGRASLATHDLRIGTGGGVPGANCVLLWSTSAADQPFHGGHLYLGGALHRYPAQSIDFVGAVEYSIPVDASMVGTRRCFQLWFQDPGDAQGIGLSDALSAYVCP